MHIVNAGALEQWKALSDEQVVARVLTGHTAMFELLMRRHTERLYRTARAVTADDQEAEVVLLQGFLEAYGRLREFDGTHRFAVWLTRIVVREALAQVRRRSRHQLLTRPVASLPEPL